MRYLFLLVYLSASLGSLWFYRRGFACLRKKQALFIWLLVTFVNWLIIFLNISLPDSGLRISAFFGGLWSFFLYYSVLAILLYGIVRAVCRLCGKKVQLARFNLWYPRIVSVVILALMPYGIYEAYTPIVVRQTVTTEKLTAPVRLVFVSDLHFGAILGIDHGVKVTRMINEQNPDLILIGGDVIDQGLGIVKRQDSLKPLSNLQAAQGVYAVLGNHDYFSGEDVALITYLEQEGIRVLVNEKVKIGQILLVGLKDFSKDQSTEFLSAQPQKEDFDLLLEHQPRRIKEAASAGYDLYLAGHTHGGAFYPNQVFTGLLHPLSYGREQFNQMTAIVSSGFGFFGVPVRIGAPPEIVVIELIPK